MSALFRTISFTFEAVRGEYLGMLRDTFLVYIEKKKNFLEK